VTRKLLLALVTLTGVVTLLLVVLVVAELIHRFVPQSVSNTAGSVRVTAAFLTTGLGVPAGKVEKGEDLLGALKREVLEETGWVVNIYPSYFQSVYVEHPEHSFVYHMYHLKTMDPIEVTIQPYEHQMYRWVTPTEALRMELVDDLDKCIEMYYFS
jgi:8-oxo-dGTP pyrophosphatase MutT (NUDIX family)